MILFCRSIGCGHLNCPNSGLGSSTRRSITILVIYMPSSEQSQVLLHILRRCRTTHCSLLLQAISMCNDAQETNHRGNMWKRLIESHNLCNISLSSGVTYTYSSGDHFTTVDYMLGDQDCVGGISSCTTLEDHSLIIYPL